MSLPSLRAGMLGGESVDASHKRIKDLERSADEASAIQRLGQLTLDAIAPAQSNAPLFNDWHTGDVAGTTRLSIGIKRP